MQKLIIFLTCNILNCQGLLQIDNQQNIEWLKELDVQEPGCPKIPEIQELRKPKSLIGEWRVLLVSSSAVFGAAHSLHQKLLKYSGLERSCFKFTVQPRPGWKSDADPMIRVVAKWPTTGANYDLACQPMKSLDSKWMCHKSGRITEEVSENSKSDGLHVYIDQDDVGGLNYALVLQCLPKYWTDWAIVSKSKVVDPKVIKHFMKKLKKMGFKVDRFIKLSHEKCWTTQLRPTTF